MKPEIKQLRDKLKGLGLNGMIVSNPISIKYLTDLDAEGILIIDPKENLFVTDSRYIESVNNNLTIDSEIVACDRKEMSKYDYEAIFEGLGDIGFEENYVTYANYKKYLEMFQVNLVETEGLIESQRIVKEPEEIEKLKKACEISDKAFEYMIKNIKKGMTEKQIAFELENYMLSNGADGIAFPSIVASGENSSMPHAVPTDRKIQEKDIITIDMGCKVNGYCSDMTRTFFVGEVPEEVKPIYDLVLKNQKQIAEQYKDGASTRSLAKMVENAFKFHGYDLVHSLGHGVGLDIHEAPYISYNSDTQLKENMVVTNEPGIYIPGKFGVRIEDTVQITKFGCISLTKSGKNYIII